LAAWQEALSAYRLARPTMQPFPHGSSQTKGEGSGYRATANARGTSA